MTKRKTTTSDNDNKIPKAVRRGDRGEVVIDGYHPEMALIHTSGYDNTDPYLEHRARMCDLSYNGPKPVKLDDPRPK